MSNTGDQRSYYMYMFDIYLHIFWEEGVGSGIQRHLTKSGGAPRFYPGVLSRIYPRVDSGRSQNLPGDSFKGV